MSSIRHKKTHVHHFRAAGKEKEVKMLRWREHVRNHTLYTVFLRSCDHWEQSAVSTMHCRKSKWWTLKGIIESRVCGLGHTHKRLKCFFLCACVCVCLLCKKMIKGYILIFMRGYWLGGGGELVNANLRERGCTCVCACVVIWVLNPKQHLHTIILSIHTSCPPILSHTHTLAVGYISNDYWTE